MAALQDADYPVTLMYLPLPWISEAAGYCDQLFGKVTLHTCTFGVIFSSQDRDVITTITNELKKGQPRIRLIFCTSSLGMGFDSPSIVRVIHGRPPRNMSDYLQQIG